MIKYGKGRAKILPARARILPATHPLKDVDSDRGQGNVYVGKTEDGGFESPYFQESAHKENRDPYTAFNRPSLARTNGE